MAYRFIMKIDLHQLQLMMNHYLGRRGHSISCWRLTEAAVLLPRSLEMGRMYVLCVPIPT